jgi:hypothetical protein
MQHKNIHQTVQISRSSFIVAIMDEGKCVDEEENIHQIKLT